jgi:membrane associated rhomboid family serine protease
MNKLVGAWIATTVTLSIFVGHVAPWAALAPSKIMHGELWRLATWPFVERSISSAALKAIVIYQFAGALAAAWSARKLAAFAIGVAVLAGLATCAIGLVVPGVAAIDRLGGWTVGATLLIAVSRQFPDRELIWFGGPFRVKAKHGVAVVLGVTLLLVVLSGLREMVPELAACGIAIVFPI